MDTVEGWMTGSPITIQVTTTLPEARELLAVRRVRRLPVVNPAGHLVGIVTEGDINRISDSPAGDLVEYNLYFRVRDLPTSEFMTHPVITVTPDTPIHEAAKLLLEYRIGGVPVVRGQEVVGVITESDLMRWIINRGGS